MARHLLPELAPATGAQQLAAVRSELEQRLLEAFRERLLQQPISEEERAERLAGVQSRVVDLLDSWQNVHDGYAGVGAEMQYQRYELDGARPLLRAMLDTEFESEHHRKFRVNRSLRDVEPEVNLFLRDLTGAAVRDGYATSRRTWRLRCVPVSSAQMTLCAPSMRLARVWRAVIYTARRATDARSSPRPPVRCATTTSIVRSSCRRSR